MKGGLLKYKNRRSLLMLFLMGCLQAEGQLTANVVLPVSGLVEKQQLWNITATNTDPSTLNIQVQVNFSEISSGQPVFSATTGVLAITTGTKQLSANTIGPVQYNVVSGNYRMDPGPSGLLPIGNFIACYDFLILKNNKVVQDCQQVTIAPLGPLLLNQPLNGSAMKEVHPQFTWLPPSPLSSMPALRYDLKLVEILSNQSAADAMQDNIPLYQARQLPATHFLYSQNTPVLEAGKIYAWQVTAMNNLAEITKSETWSFSISQDAVPGRISRADPSYFKLKKAGAQDGYAVYRGSVRFDYLNETTDTTWNIEVEDISEARHTRFALTLDSVKLIRGQNLVNYDAASDNRFIDKHQYLLKVMNSRKEVWQVRFEYRKQ